jgi:tRNA(Ile)-lysidine synthase
LIAYIKPFLPKSGAVAVALSGGSDSMALTKLLSLCVEENEGLIIHALTVDHNLRPESAKEAKQVGQWVKNWTGVQHKILTRMISKKSKETKIIESARADRYTLLEEYCRKNKIDRLFTAHHQDDQAETFLFRLAKGSGLDGLAAMLPVSTQGNVQRVRPLLNLPKQELVEFCQSYKIPFVCDPTNDKQDYARNRLRQAHDILEREGLTNERLATTAKRLNRARQALDHYAAKAFETALIQRDKVAITFQFSLLQQEPKETQLRVVLQALEELHPKTDYGVRLKNLEQIVEDFFSVEPFRKRTLGGFVFSRQDKHGHVRIELEK